MYQPNLLHPIKNSLLEKFFENYPNLHLFKFLVNHRKNRVLTYILFKFMYWAWFKIVNRIELQNTHYLKDLERKTNGNAFLIIENHVCVNDVLMHYAIWAHLGFMTYVFTTEGSFYQGNPAVPMLAHFSEMIPRFGKGEDSVLRMVDRLESGDIVNIFPAGTYPRNKYANSGFVQEPFTGAARVAYQYWKRNKKDLIIQPTCSLGGNIAYPPKRYLKYEQKINQKIIIKFGKPFSVKFSENPSYEEIKDKSNFMQMKIAEIWGQKKLIPNVVKQLMKERSGDNPRKYGNKIYHHKKKKNRLKKNKKANKKTNKKNLL